MRNDFDVMNDDEAIRTFGYPMHVQSLADVSAALQNGGPNVAFSGIEILAAPQQIILDVDEDVDLWSEHLRETLTCVAQCAPGCVITIIPKHTPSEGLALVLDAASPTCLYRQISAEQPGDWKIGSLDDAASALLTLPVWNEIVF